MSHRACPWGGHLVKIDCRNVFIQGAEKDPTSVMIRPEVRGQYSGAPVEIAARCLRVHCPGDAVIERSTRMWVVRMLWLLFGHCHGRGNDSHGHFYHFDGTDVARHHLRRNWPEPSDCSYIGQGVLWISRPEAGSKRNRFQIVMVFRTPDEKKFARWAFPLYSMIADMIHKATERLLNSRAFQEMRRMDAEFYVVLSMRSFNRGPPMIPHPGDGVETFTITAGKTLGLTSWSRFPLKKGRFCLADYLQCFAEQLGHKLITYDILDGWTLVSYQCVVKRSDWNKVKMSFREAFRIQKAAYRRANGGSAAPGLTEDVPPHLLLDPVEPAEPAEVEITECLKTVVRNTFLEVDEEVGDGPPMRRTKSDLSGDVKSFIV